MVYSAFGSPQNAFDPDLTQTGNFPEIPLSVTSDAVPPLPEGEARQIAKPKDSPWLPPLGELSAKLTERVVLRFCALVASECLLQQISHRCRCLFLHLVRGVGVGGKGESGAAMTQHAGYSLDIDSVLQGNYDSIPLVSHGTRGILFWGMVIAYDIDFRAKIQ